MPTTKTATASISTLDDPVAVEDAGGKASALARLRQGGFPVPAGVALTADQARAVADDDPNAQELLDAIEAALGDQPCAVRSSAVAEDLDDASFAGQYETVLGVRGRDRLAAAIRTTARSGQAAHARAYGQAAGTTANETIPVVIMPMVAATAAGVAFSADPVTGDDHAVVSAVTGLGNRLVDGTVTPDEWTVSTSGETHHRFSVDERLNDLPVDRVAALARRIAEAEGHPADIEWAMDGDGHLILLQARPMSILPAPPEHEWEAGLWQKDLVHYPQQMTPFGASTFLATVSRGMEAMAREWGLVIDRLDQVCVGGEVYGRVVPVGVPPARTAGSPPPAPVLGLLARLVPSMRNRMRVARQRLGRGDLERLPEQWRREWRPEMEAALDAALGVDLSALDEHGLVGELDRTLALLDRGQYIHFQLFLAHTVGLAEFVRACEQQLAMTTIEALAVLQGTSPTSAAPALEMAALADRAQASPGVQRVLEQPSGNLVEELRAVDERLADDLDSWLRRYGWRTNNYDPGAPALAEQPGAIVALLRSGGSRTTDSTPSGLTAFRERLARLPASQQHRMNALLDTALATYGLREENSLPCDGLASGAIRRVLIEAGQRLAARRAIAQADDIAMLTADEVRAALQDGVTEPLRALVRRRRAEQAWVAAHPGPLFVGGQPSPPPDPRHLPAAGRRLMQAFGFMFAHEYGEPEVPSGPGLRGIGASAGSYRGRVRVLRSDRDFARLQPGEVMVCPVTTPTWSPLFSVAGALVTDHGGVVSHASIVARENGLPAVVGTGTATRQLADGVEVTVDGTAGTVRIH